MIKLILILSEDWNGNYLKKLFLIDVFSILKIDITHFNTAIFRAVAASISILSTPAPARPITFNFSPAAITSAVTLVSDRTIRAS